MSDNQKFLTLMVEKFSQKHGYPPDKIVVAPVALVALGLKRSLAPTWGTIPVTCRLFATDEVAAKHEKSKATSLGVFVKETRGQLKLVACDLV